jgi:protein gp37
LNRTSIAWTNFSSNPIHFIIRETGKRGWLCTKVSKGCTNCYSETINKRYGNKLDYNQVSLGKGDWVLYEKEFREWTKMETPSMIFVCDMTDFFHPEIPDRFREKIFDAMNSAPWHTFQVLTKRPEEALRYFGERNDRDVWSFPENLWLGTSVEGLDYVDRIDILRKIPVQVRFLSFEPLLEDIGEVDLSGIDWIIVGAESGALRRPFNPDWAYSLLAQARQQGVKFFFKQGSGRFSGSLVGIPQDLIVREFPYIKSLHANPLSYPAKQ